MGIWFIAYYWASWFTTVHNDPSESIMIHPFIQSQIQPPVHPLVRRYPMFIIVYPF